MAKYQNRAVVILYEGAQLTDDVEEALLKIVAPFTGRAKSRANILQLDANDIASAIAGKVITEKPKVIQFGVKTPESEAAALVGLTFEDELKSQNPVGLAIAIYNAVSHAKANATDSSVALLRALKLVSKAGFSFQVGNTTLEKYYLTAGNLQVIRDVLRAQGIAYE